MGSGGVTIVVLSSVICLKMLFSDGLGGEELGQIAIKKENLDKGVLL